MSNELADAKYVSLATYKRSGAEVATPVWAAQDGEEFFVFSAGDAGKVKRLRNSDRAKLAVCDFAGKLLGEWHAASATVLGEPQDIARALDALRAKYGFQMWLADVGAKLTGRFNKRAYIRVRLTDG